MRAQIHAPRLLAQAQNEKIMVFRRARAQNEVCPAASDGVKLCKLDPGLGSEYLESRLRKRRDLELAPFPNIRAYYDYWLEVMVQATWGVLTLDYCNLNSSLTERTSILRTPSEWPLGGGGGAPPNLVMTEVS